MPPHVFANVLRLDRDARLRLLVLAFFTVVGALEALQVYLAGRSGGPRLLWSSAVVAQMGWWYLWAAAVPLIVTLGRRIRLNGPAPVRSAAAHLALSGAVAYGHLTAASALFYYAVSRGSWIPSLSVQRQMFARGYLVSGIITYWGVLGAWYAFEAFRRLRDEELASARLQAHNAALEAGLAEARLEALRRQLNPHFLFNTLHTVTGLVVSERKRMASLMLTRLGDLLRVSLGRDGQQVVKLREDLELLDAYLDIERVRLGSRLRVERSVTDEALEVDVPIFLLQPLVENAILHGLERTPGPGRLSVRGCRQGDMLRLEVEDSGPGPDPRRREGVGLANTRARVRHLHGARATVRLVPPEGARGTRTIVSIPVETDRG